MTTPFAALRLRSARHRLAGPVLAFATAVSILGAPTGAPAEDQQTLIDTGNRLAALLRAGRTVVSANQGLINDPSLGDKGLTPDVFMAQVTDAYVAANGAPPLTDGLTDLQRQLTEAQLAAMRAVVAESEPLINMPEMAFKGFIPAVFARLVNERFGESVGEIATVKVTAPPELVRNRTARPDAWEEGVIETRLGAPGHQKGAAWSEMVAGPGGERFRMLIPEYYAKSCLSCHGEPAGEVDVTGFPKEGGKEGDLGGAISITLSQTP